MTQSLKDSIREIFKSLNKEAYSRSLRNGPDSKYISHFVKGLVSGIKIEIGIYLTISRSGSSLRIVVGNA